MKPNILYVFTDQQQSGAMSSSGNNNLETPAVDRLASEGLRFTRAYCAQAVCMPSRAAMQTGRWPHANGIIVNHGSAEGSFDMALGYQSRGGARPLLAQTFGDAGYETAYFGRWHITLPTERHDLHGYDSVWQHDADDDKIAPDFQHFLESRSDKPFFAVVSICNPHDICRWPKDETMPNGPIADPPESLPSLPDNFEPMSDEPQVFREFQNAQAQSYVAPAYEPHQWREYRWAYWRFVEKADAIVGRVIDALDSRGLRENTTIVFASDHGEGAASHRWCQKQALYEESVNVPFIIAPPLCKRAGQVDEHFVNAGVDLYPTLCELADIERPHWLHGRSVTPLLENDTVEEWPDYVVTEAEFHGGNDPFGARGRMLRTERYKYAAFNRGEPDELLIDLQEDPGEMQNLVNDPSYREILYEHRERLREWCINFDDYFMPPKGK